MLLLLQELIQIQHSMKHLNSLAIVLGIFVFGTIHLSARVISPEQALQRACSSGDFRAKARAYSSPELVYTVDVSSSSEPGAYVFSSDRNGFLVLSADDEAPAVLGYSDSGSVSPEDMPPAFRYWLDQYAAQIEAARLYGVRKASVTRPSREPIAPMVSTRWNQGAPYNDMAPLMDGQRSVTGCVATALAQIMNYHQWPPVGRGSNSYKWNNTTLSLDFSTIEFDWENMLNVYNSSATQAQKDAVAQLMYACGVAVNMNYSPNSSGALSALIASAMYNYFDYDKAVLVMDRDFYGLIEWEDIVYDQLQNYGPVQYSGITATREGHSFVCDGYSSDGYFHINWGWGGMSDGYFLLTALDPESQGIGGASSGFDYMQDIVANVARPKSNTSFAELFTAEGFTITDTSVALGNEATFNDFLNNGGIVAVSGQFGMKAVAESGAVTYLPSFSFSGLMPMYGYDGFEFLIPATLAEGTYRISPVFKLDGGQWQDVKVPITAPSYYIMTVTGKTAFFTRPAAVTVSITDVEAMPEIYVNVNTRITAEVANDFTSDYYGNIVAALYSGSEMYAVGPAVLLNVPGQDSQSLEYIGRFTTDLNGKTVAAGNYSLCFADASTHEALSKPVEVKVFAATSTSLNVTDLKVNSNNVVTDLGEITFSGSLNVSRGAFGDVINIFIFTINGGSSSTYVTSSPVFATAGQSVPFSFKGALPGLQDKTKYRAGAYIGTTAVSAPVEFVVDFSSGIEDLNVPAASMQPAVTDGITTFTGQTPYVIRVYSLSGTMVGEVSGQASVDLSKYPSGMYIFEIFSDTQNTKIINRVIRR